MMRLPWFEYRAPSTLPEAARILAGEGPNAMLIAGGTDLLLHEAIDLDLVAGRYPASPRP